VGFSGGRDSLALAAALRWVGTRLGVEILLIHIDHGMRESSREEARRASVLAESLRLRCEVVPVALPLNELRGGVGIEEAARRERYHVLFDVASRERALAVVTAHHQEDQAETVLLHLLRGSGVHGAAGMGERSPAPVAARAASDISPNPMPEQAWLWRPLLLESRAAIEAYVAELELEPVEDPSNQDLSLRRNVIRHKVLPLLEAEFPGAAAALARYGRLAAADDCFLDRLAGAVHDELTTADGTLDASRLVEQPLAIQRRVVQRWVLLRTTVEALSANRTAAILALAEERHGGRGVEIGEGWTVRLERAMLRLEPGESGGGDSDG
jgi:tRNA(Ile)-lysidine synthase